MTFVDEAPLVAGAMNFRDTGGLSAGVGFTRRSILFRSGNLARLEPAGTRALGELGLRRIIDLRSDTEVTHEPSRIEGLPITTQHVPLFLGSVASMFANDISLDEMYQLLLDDSALGVVAAVRGIISDQPVLVHCTVGKDRTGVVVAIALASAGVDVDAVVGDYARTESLLPAQRNEAVVARLRQRHPEARHIEDLATRSPAPVMSSLLSRVSERYGSAADYLRAHGISDDEIDELRRVLIES
ncbi:tyrosine-protein phosphatase [Microbacterium sp. NPDC076911]|uniref:tyrosine-protein phosphatase n=1 Tax=Microbacterium sp. NPDC076911 TaxID=3154958 RepID=UPI0034138D17